MTTGRMPSAYVPTRCPGSRTETLMTGLPVLSMALVIVRWSGAANPCSAAAVRRHE